LEAVFIMVSRQRQTSCKYGPAGFGPLEAQVIGILWAEGWCSVSQVAQRLSRKRAYTTILTTLVRLFRKGILKRRKHERTFVYALKLSLDQWAKKSASEALTRFLATPGASRELLIFCLVENVFKHDATLLSDLNASVAKDAAGQKLAR
jgi:predicted transcriptional regulator